ncbi:hypothetical protein [Streptomyces mirabilis]
MRRTMRTIAARPGVIAVAGLEFVVLLAVAGIGGWLGYNMPGSTPTWAAAAFAGIVGLVLAFGASKLLDSVMSALRALTRTSPSPAHESDTQATEEDLPSNAKALIDRLAEAARAGAAHEAALFCGKVDPAYNLLHKAERWVGIDGTSALFPLTDGAYLHYRKNDGGDRTIHEYTFVVQENENEPVPVTSMEQVRDLLEQHVNRELEEDQVSA